MRIKMEATFKETCLMRADIKVNAKTSDENSIGADTYRLKRTVQRILQQFFKDEKTKLTGDALTLITEVITVFVAEAAGRTAKQAKKDGDDELTLEQFEKILPQLLLDV